MVIRKFNAGDKSFVYATWLRGLYHGSPYWSCTTAKDFYEIMGRHIDEVLKTSEVLVISDMTEPDLILGYAVIEGPCLHWVYIKSEGRTQGLARLLLKDKCIKYVTYLTSIGDSIRRKYKWEFYPWGLK